MPNDTAFGPSWDGDTTTAASRNALYDKIFSLENVVNNNASTGILDGYVITTNGGGDANFNVSAGTGLIVDSTTDTLNPTVDVISSGPFGPIAATFIASSEFTHIYITPGGTVLQETTEPTAIKRRQNIYLGRIVHSDNIVVNLATFQPEIIINPSNVFNDIFNELMIIITSGNRISANGVNLSIDKSAGNIHQIGVNWDVDKRRPNVKTLGSLIPITFRYRTQTGTESADTTVLDPTVYDNAGTVTGIGGSNNQATNVRVYMFASGNIRIQYGQQVYSTLPLAISGLQSEPFILEGNIADNAILLGAISVTKGASDLSDESDAKFSSASAFGEISTGTGASSVSTLQNAYDNSINPEIVINSTNGAVTVRDNAAPIGADLFEVQSNGGGINYFTVDAARTAIHRLFSLTPPPTVAIDAGGNISPFYSFMLIEPNTGTTDSVTNIFSTGLGDLLILQNSDNANTINIIHGANIFLTNAETFVMTSINDVIGFIFNGVYWQEIFRSNHTIGMINDFNASGAVNGNILRYDGTQWSISANPDVEIGINQSATTGTDVIRIGAQAGNGGGTSNNIISIGENSGLTSQGENSIAIGSNSGASQGTSSIAIGNVSGVSQGNDSIAIGSNSGASQGTSSIAIGNLAGDGTQPTNTIIINATGLSLNTATTNTCYIAPLRQQTNAGTGSVSLPPGGYNMMAYNPTTKEVVYLS